MSMLPERLRHRIEAAGLQPVDLALADWGWRHGGGTDGAGALALASHALGLGHTCIRLGDAEATLGAAAGLLPADPAATLADNPLVMGATSAVTRPLVLDAGRLYLQRYHDYEVRLAARIGDRLAVPPVAVDAVDDRAPDNGAGFAPDWQAVGLFVARRHRFAVISGGPGTGKTHTIVRLMIRLIADALEAGEAPPVFRLAAPTGKAAARMMTAVETGLEVVQPAADIRTHLPVAATTLHRLLRLSPTTTHAGRDRQRPIPADVVIVDEASMVDLPLMTKLAEAVPDSARLILLGDRYQLASVESGAVLADLCAPAGVNAFTDNQARAARSLLGGHEPAAAEHPLADHVVTLQTGRRFTADSPVGRLALAINNGDIGAVESVIAASDATLRATFDTGEDSIADLVAAMTEACMPLHTADAPEAALDSLERVRLLTATRIGPLGSDALNARIASALARHFGFHPDSAWYHGRPIMITRNDPRAGLFNGDVGVVRADGRGGTTVWFRTEAGLRGFHPWACPAHVSVYAMTVHKSQGSEFDHVHLLLPPAGSRSLSRELLYTGATRARQGLHLVTTPAALAEAVARTSERASGLAERLGGTRQL